jgi:DNA-binding response OmpR family regulator
VRADRRWSAIPLLFLTAREAEEDIRYAKTLGVDDYLVKPIEPEDLLAAVYDWLRAGASRSQHA